MNSRAHHTDYDEETTARCERALVTLLGDLGPWRERIYLAGGLAPRYLIGQLPEGARAHVGTTDIDLVIGLALGDETPETYRTLQNNLEKSGFRQSEPSFRWTRDVEGVKVVVEFLCETDQEDFGRIFRPKGESTGSKLGAFNVRGAHLAREIFSFQQRHENKDAYDMVFTLFNHKRGPSEAGAAAAASPVAGHEQVADALALLAERFADADQDGPSAYALFLADPDDEEERARLRQEAVATVREFLAGFSGA